MMVGFSKGKNMNIAIFNENKYLQFDKLKYIVYFLSVFVSFSFYKELFLYPLHHEVARYVGYFASIALVIISYPLTFANATRAIRILIGSLSVVFALYLVFSTVPVTFSDVSLWDFIELKLLLWVAILCSLLTFWRIGFSLFLFSYVFWNKTVQSDFFGVVISVTDYMPLIEVGVFIFFSMLMFLLLQKRLNLPTKVEEGRFGLLDIAVLASVAIHFANYFYSGLEKIIISDMSPFFWAIHNQTHNLILAALTVGQLPISFSPTLTQWVYDFFSENIIITNFFVLIIQLASVFAISNIRATIILTFLYDMMHIGIFFLTGIFFYKWIILNFVIIIALQGFRKQRLRMKESLFLCMIVLFAPNLFYTTKLGWFDSPVLNGDYLEAVFDDGEVFAIPSNYYLGLSIAHAQHRINRKREGEFSKVGTYGSVSHQQIYQKAIDFCQLNKDNNIKLTRSDLSVNFSQSTVDRVKGYIQKLHNFYVYEEKRNGEPYQFDWYPHHIFSMPWTEETFKARFKKDMVGYRYVFVSSCLNMDDGLEKNRLNLRYDRMIYDVQD